MVKQSPYDFAGHCYFNDEALLDLLLHENFDKPTNLKLIRERVEGLISSVVVVRFCDGCLGCARLWSIRRDRDPRWMGKDLGYCLLKVVLSLNELGTIRSCKYSKSSPEFPALLPFGDVF
jgi:hypothetical protein